VIGRKFLECGEDSSMATFSNRHDFGKWGEEIALDYLTARGYQYVTANYRCSYGEIDLICRDGPVWCFIEVKTRRTTNYGRGYSGVTPVKLKHLLKTAQMYLVSHCLYDVAARIDIVSIDFTNDTDYQIELIRNATAK
jgi:putative endonuclease